NAATRSSPSSTKRRRLYGGGRGNSEMLERIEDMEDLKTLKEMRKIPLKFKKLKDFLKEYQPDASGLYTR
ncbi:MAG: hypothetical protein NUW09_06440, partial [Deltaproteobacteria bacterium]|nr:hypothetical protein [Deltaproteobacteria bacterium]